jgi:hypothetical protein
MRDAIEAVTGTCNGKGTVCSVSNNRQETTQLMHASIKGYLLLLRSNSAQ